MAPTGGPYRPLFGAAVLGAVIKNRNYFFCFPTIRLLYSYSDILYTYMYHDLLVRLLPLVIESIVQPVLFLLIDILDSFNYVMREIVMGE